MITSFSADKTCDKYYITVKAYGKTLVLAQGFNKVRLKKKLLDVRLKYPNAKLIKKVVRLSYLLGSSGVE
jgi:hypothetical protein